MVGNASRFTNALSAFGHYKFRGVNIPFRLVGTNRAFGAAGRLNLAAGAGVGAYDLTSVGLCVTHHL